MVLSRGCYLSSVSGSISPLHSTFIYLRISGQLTCPGDRLAGCQRDLPDNWVELTRQLRMYAISTGVRQSLVMDECTAIYFKFPKSLTEEMKPVKYLVVTTDLDAGKGIPVFTVRGPVVYVLLRALDDKGIELCDSQPVTQPQARYQNVLGAGPSPANDPLRTRGHANNQSAGKRPVLQAELTTPSSTISTAGYSAPPLSLSLCRNLLPCEMGMNCNTTSPNPPTLVSPMGDHRHANCYVI